ncbi:group II intron reverse transcriptase/maturase, partial [Bacillus thuringiensis]|nr:group II intron reverse transcriptase/maturase [Bacillus thuringiensis]
IHTIKGNKGSKTAGTDGKTMDYYLQMRRDKLMSLIRRNSNHYQPRPVSSKSIPMSNGKQRHLRIPNMIDCIRRELAKIVIEPIASAKFYHNSFCFRP